MIVFYKVAAVVLGIVCFIFVTAVQMSADHKDGLASIVFGLGALSTGALCVISWTQARKQEKQKKKNFIVSES